MDYQILTATTATELAALVNEQIARGWVPCGGVEATAYYASWENERDGCTESEKYTEYAQAMTSTDESNW